MNIISNNCVGAAIYQELNIKYNNPFMWCFINGKDFYTLINEYDDINFNNYNIMKSCLDKETNLYDKSYSLCIDNKIYLHYIHYINNDNYNVPTKKSDITGEHSRDILYKYADKLCLEKYKNRLNRMNSEPVFIISLSKYSTFDEIRNIMYLKSNYKRIFLLPKNFNYDKNKIDKNCEFILQPEDGVKWTNEKAIFLLKHSKILKEIINV